ncbi:hypothetical protein DUI87_13008 [Hirundo rustica rustica]|uniref:V-type proton ATPase subunit S1 n=1 Tax=Hirundo rustica rustica TaxID=333673 RepID=A0A3M0KST7_HIRRU|nr:hypothetical protein DUI87_13008 [Hirundo rustica rustica]
MHSPGAMTRLCPAAPALLLCSLAALLQMSQSLDHVPMLLWSTQRSQWNPDTAVHEGQVVSAQELTELLQPLFTQNSRNLVLFLQDREILQSSPSSLVLPAVECKATRYLLSVLQESGDWKLTNVTNLNISQLEVNASNPNLLVVQLQPLSSDLKEISTLEAIAENGLAVVHSMTENKNAIDKFRELSLKYTKPVNGISSLEIRFLMTNKFYGVSARKWSTLNSVEIVQDGEKFAKYNVSGISAPAEYSFHCQLVGTSNLYPARLVPSNDEAKNWDVFISELQIQGFNIINNQFSYASDCTGFFTPGIWMGLVTSIILVWILTYGIHMIMQLTTNNRFDDPKGPALSVPQTE